MSKLYESYVEAMRKIADVGHAIAVLSWDKEVNLPAEGAAFRAQQIATLSGIAHELFTDVRLGKTLESLGGDRSLNAAQRRNVDISQKEYDKAMKFDQAFVIRRSKIISKTYQAWLQGRAHNDADPYLDALEALVQVKREEADILGFEDHPYDALLDAYEPDTKAADVDHLFQALKPKLQGLIQTINTQEQVDDAFLRQSYPKDDQWAFGLELLRQMGYDLDRGRQDISPHPFTTTFGPTDVRVTTRVHVNDLANMTWSCIHEGGHALYEQGLPESEYGLPSGRAVSLGIHESQSRLWENNVGRSRAYWVYNYPRLQTRFPTHLTNVSLDAFYRGINKISPSLIRTESDELHYHFHIIIRFEIEKALIEGSLAVAEIKEQWHSKYRAYLGLEIPDDRSGILQDVHWGHGSMGYFPTYTLGSLYAAQFYHRAKQDIDDLTQLIEAGDLRPLRKWLGEKIHQYGRRYTAEELCTRVTGQALQIDFFMDYVREKFQSIYGF